VKISGINPNTRLTLIALFISFFNSAGEESEITENVTSERGNTIAKTTIPTKRKKVIPLNLSTDENPDTGLFVKINMLQINMPRYNNEFEKLLISKYIINTAAIIQAATGKIAKTHK
jgi:hypothetical protein